MKNRFLYLVLLALLSLTLAGAVCAQDGEPPMDRHDGRIADGPVSQEPEWVPVGPAPATAMPTPVSAELPDAFLEGRNVHDLGPVTPDRVAAADKEAEARWPDPSIRPVRVGLVRSTGEVPPSLSSDTTIAHALPDGRTLWTLAIRSPEAYGIRVHVHDFDVGTGSAIIYGWLDKQIVARGPFTGRGPDGSGEFWTASLPGDVAFIEVSGHEDAHLQIDKIVHFDKPPGGQSSTIVSPNAHSSSVPALSDEVTENAAVVATPTPPVPEPVHPCHLDAMCHDDSIPARDATAHINFVSGSDSFVCSGTIVNDLDNETWVPYFLTAHHCLHTQVEVSTMETVFFWQKDSCDGALPNFDTLPRMVGGTLLSTSSTDAGNDMTFIRLSGDLPGGVTMAGWTTADPDWGWGIGYHHPAGSWKRYSNFSYVPPRFHDDCVNRPASLYHYLIVGEGMVEGGSSGSGLFDGLAHLTGQLYGACPKSGVEPGCDNKDEWYAIYGKFSETYKHIAWWLSVGGTIYVNSQQCDPEFQYGTAILPFCTVNGGNNVAWDGVRLKIKAGSYNETVTFSRPMTVLAYDGTVTIGE